MKEEPLPLPKIETIGQLHNALFMGKLTRHDSSGYVLGLERTVGAEERFMSHVYKGRYDELEKGMCSKAYNRGKDGTPSRFKGS